MYGTCFISLSILLIYSINSVIQQANAKDILANAKPITCGVKEIWCAREKCCTPENWASDCLEYTIAYYTLFSAFDKQYRTDISTSVIAVYNCTPIIETIRAAYANYSRCWETQEGGGELLLDLDDVIRTANNSVGTTIFNSFWHP
jgi:hypothetical protein